MQSSESLLVLVVVALSCCLLVQVQAGPAKMAPEECSKRAVELDGLLEDDGEKLIGIVEGPGYQNNESRIRQGIVKLVERAMELGEMKGCAKDNIHEPGDVNEAKKEQLHETIVIVSGALPDLSPRSQQLFKEIIEEAQAAYNKL